MPNKSATQRVIKLAVKGKLKKKFLPTNIMSQPIALFDETHFLALCSKKEFWQALGKSLGWFQDDCKGRKHIYRTCWRCEWHSFIDHLAKGKDPNSFFADLIKNL